MFDDELTWRVVDHQEFPKYPVIGSLTERLETANSSVNESGFFLRYPSLNGLELFTNIYKIGFHLNMHTVQHS